MKKTAPASKSALRENKNPNQALYLKYRPQKFAEVIGQSQVTDVLHAALKQGNVAHAYLFSGSRGTGKTSVARILAREIGTTERDLYEIDAASHNGVEEVRRLNESVSTLPFDSKYKVYILDEVHMLSKSAFNALLKTLEEPPEHAVFILATTEVEKLPETVISRCEHYNFKPPTRAVLKKLAIETAMAEGYKLESDAAELLAIVADGAFRDLHTNLQKLIRSSADKKLTLDEVERVTGAPNAAIINDVVEAIISRGDENSLEKGLSAISAAKEKNYDAKVFLKVLLEKIRAVLVLKIAPSRSDLIEDALSDDEVKNFVRLLSVRLLSGGAVGGVGNAVGGAGSAVGGAGGATVSAGNSASAGAPGENSANINSKVLARLLAVYDETLRSPLPYLPLELALIDFFVPPAPNVRTTPVDFDAKKG